MDISEIKYRTQETSPYFFTHNTLKFFGQTMKDFRVYKQLDGKFLVTAPIRNDEGKVIGETKRLFNPATNELEHIPAQVSQGTQIHSEASECPYRSGTRCIILMGSDCDSSPESCSLLKGPSARSAISQDTVDFIRSCGGKMVYAGDWGRFRTGDRITDEEGNEGKIIDRTPIYSDNVYVQFDNEPAEETIHASRLRRLPPPPATKRLE